MTPAPAEAATAVLVVGEALVDITRAPGRPDIEHAGGSPLNVAVGLARLGVPVTLATTLGDDRHGDLVRDHLSASGVRLAELAPAARTSTATAVLDESGAATYRFDLDWDPAGLPAPHPYGLLHVGSIGSWLPPGAEAVARLVQAARDSGVPVSFDPNIRRSVSPPLEPLRRQVLQVAGWSAVVKLSDEDAGALTLTDDPADVVDDLFATGGPALVVRTRGPAGSTLRTRALRLDVPAPPVDVSDTIGAGDTYLAALLAGLLAVGWTPRARFDRQELRWLGELAAAAAAVTCSRPGADPPWPHELSQLRSAPGGGRGHHS